METVRTLRSVVLFDGLCVLCRGSVRAIRRLDWRGRLEYVDVQDWARVTGRFPAIDRAEALGEIHVVRPDGVILKGYGGMRHIAGRLPLLSLFAPLLYLPGIAWLGPRVYRFVARRRYQINRLFGNPICEDGSCKLP